MVFRETKMKISMKFGKIALLTNILLVSTASLAGGSHDHDHSNKAGSGLIETEFGEYGTQMHPTVTIEISMSDDMRFTPATIQVKQGDIVEFIHANEVQLMHEFVLGTLQSLNKHAEQMKQNPSMSHDKPFTVNIAPGETGTNTWQSTESGVFHFGCLIPGHYEAGMRGTVIVGS
jgi:uncharacterized cupredoxin-like copper-binding protein